VGHLGGLVARVTRRIGVQADVVAVQRDEAISVIAKLVIPRLEAKRGGHLGLVFVGHAEIVIAKDMVMVGLELAVNWRHVRKTLEVAVDEIAEMHDKLQIEPVQVLDTLCQFFR